MPRENAKLPETGELLQRAYEFAESKGIRMFMSAGGSVTHDGMVVFLDKSVLWALVEEAEVFRIAAGSTEDWTAHNGVANSSAKYLSLVSEVASIIREDAHKLLAGRADMTARLIMSHLAHKHGLAPKGSGQ